jgi:hypothetical protein
MGFHRVRSRLFLVILLAVPAAGLCFAAPGTAQGKTPKGRSIVGTWRSKAGAGRLQSYFTLRPKGTYSFRSLDGLGRVVYREEGKYTFAEGKLFTVSKRGQQQTVEVVWQGKHRARFAMAGGQGNGRSTFTRILTR